jgi:hypothetical protein
MSLTGITPGPKSDLTTTFTWCQRPYMSRTAAGSACGLEVEEVVAEGDPPPPEPEPRYESLFNDFRIAVFRMRQRDHPAE